MSIQTWGAGAPAGRKIKFLGLCLGSKLLLHPWGKSAPPPRSAKSDIFIGRGGCGV